MFQGSYSQLNCCSGFPRSLNELPRQLVIRKLAAISWWKARDRTGQLSVLFPALITALPATPFSDGLRNCFSALVKSASWCLFSGDRCAVPAWGVLRGKGCVFSTRDLRHNPPVLVVWVGCFFLMPMWQQGTQVWFWLLMRGGWNFLFPCGLGSASFSCFVLYGVLHLSQRYLRSRQILWTTPKCLLAWFYTRLWPQLWLMISTCR